MRELVALQIDDMRLEEFVQPMPTIRSADAAFSPTSMKSLHGFEILAIDVSLAKSNLLTRT